MKSIRSRRDPFPFCVVALFLGALGLSAAAQSPPSSAPEDRPLQLDSIGSPRLELVIPPQIAGDGVAAEIFWMGRVPIGFEGADGPAQPFRWARVDMTGAAVRDGLDALVRTDPRYLWQRMNDVIVVRPVLAAADPHNLLNQPVRNIDWPDVTVEQALLNVQGLIRGSSNGPSTFPAPAHDVRRVSVRVQSGSVLDVLNEIVRAHGELMWSVVYAGRQPGGVVQTSPQLSIKWLDGHAVGEVRVRPSF